MLVGVRDVRMPVRVFLTAHRGRLWTSRQPPFLGNSLQVSHSRSLRTYRRLVWGRYVQRPNTVRNAPGSAPIFISIGLSYVTFVDVMWEVGIEAGETPADQ